MIRYSTLAILLLFSSQLLAQDIFVFVRGNKLQKFTPETCQMSFVADFGSQSFTDIALHKNGNMYGIRSTGDIYSMNINTGASTLVKSLIHSPSGGIYTSMTSGADGNLYIASIGGDIVLYDPDADVENYIGSVPYTAEGDLTFRDGQLYLGSTDTIVKVNLNNPFRSTTEDWFTSSKPIWGIVTDYVDCDTKITYAMTGGSSPSVFYEINIAEQTSSEICRLPINVYGATTEDEFKESVETTIELDATPASCGQDNGQLEIITVFDDLRYSISGLVTDVEQADVEALEFAEGEYTLIVTDADGCVKEYDFTINAVATTIDVDLNTTEITDCENNQLGQVAITINEGENLTFTLDGYVENSSDLVIENLPKGNYTLKIEDGSGCTATEQFEIIENCDDVVEPEPPVDEPSEFINVPGAFAPNGNGVNERFAVLTSYENVQIDSYMIYNRWGNQIFTASQFDYSNSENYWDGTMQSGERFEGPFLYLITYTINDGGAEQSGQLAGQSIVVR